MPRPNSLPTDKNLGPEGPIFVFFVPFVVDFRTVTDQITLRALRMSSRAFLAQAPSPDFSPLVVVLTCGDVSLRLW